MQRGEVRRRILEDHLELRGLLGEVEALVARFQDGDAEVGDALRQRARALYGRLKTHLALEDEVLAPALREAGAGRRADHLDREHREQRELLGYLLGRLDGPGPLTWLVARELASFVEYVRQDMRHEEEVLLGEALLDEAG